MYTTVAATTPGSPRSNVFALLHFEPARSFISDALPLPVPSRPSNPSTASHNPRTDSLTTQDFISDAFGHGFLPENPVFSHLVGRLAWWHISKPPAAARVELGGVGTIHVPIPHLCEGVATGIGTDMEMDVDADVIHGRYGDSDVSGVAGSGWEKRRSWDARRYGLLGVFELEGRSIRRVAVEM
jgi:hypothetical protein